MPTTRPYDAVGYDPRLRPGSRPDDFGAPGDPRPPAPSGEPGASRGPRGGASGRGGFRSPLGSGAVVGIGGAVAFLAALVLLPWFTVAGDDLTLGDIRTAYEVPATDPEGLPGSGGSTESTLPEGEIPSPDEVAGVVEEQVRDTAAETVASAIDGGRSRYLELYATTLWLPIAGVVGVAAVASTLLAPRSAALSLLLGVRRLAGVLVVLAGAAHALALWIVFSGDGAPSPATGVWIGVAGLVGVLAGCVIGPRR